VGRLTHRTGAGYTYFVTTKTWENRDLFRVSENSEILAQCLMHYRKKGTYLLHEFVVMTNHLHLLLTPNNETSLERAMQFIKGGSSHEIHKQRGHKMQIWQAGFHESTIRDDQDFVSRRQYIRMNPVEARLVSRPEDWAYSSASGRFTLDVQPMGLSSGAKARLNAETSIVGAKAPTP
jgi:putative transposase